MYEETGKCQWKRKRNSCSKEQLKSLSLRVAEAELIPVWGVIVERRQRKREQRMSERVRVWW